MTKKKRDLKALLPDEVVNKILVGCEKLEDIVGG